MLSMFISFLIFTLNNYEYCICYHMLIYAVKLVTMNETEIFQEFLLVLCFNGILVFNLKTNGLALKVKNFVAF
jgi:hypothetical protein